MKTSETTKEIATALANAQGAMSPAIKDSSNPAFKGSKYADLTAVWESIRGPLTSNGISVLQDVENHGEAISVVTRLQHSSGEYFEFGPLTIPMAKMDAHGVGSATTYGRRFALSAAVGVVADVDDDANGAVGKHGRQEQEPEPEPDRSVAHYELRVAVKTAGQEMERKAGGIWHEHIREASKYDKDGKPQQFGDPFNPKVGEKWLKLTQKNLDMRLADLAKTDAAAAEAADLFTDSAKTAEEVTA